MSLPLCSFYSQPFDVQMVAFTQLTKRITSVYINRSMLFRKFLPRHLTMPIYAFQQLCSMPIVSAITYFMVQQVRGFKDCAAACSSQLKHKILRQ